MSQEIETLRPDSREEVQRRVSDLAERGLGYCVEGLGTRREYAAPEGDIEVRLSVSRLDRIERLDPEDLSCRVQCGLRLGDLLESLREEDLALESGPFLAPEARSLGGVFSEAPASPRGFDRGSIRSQLLGLAGLDPRGRAFEAGGRVVKNVAGYDLMKLFVGGGGAWFTGLELELRLIRRPELSRRLASPRMPVSEALELWRSLRPDWIEARALDLHLQGDGSAIVEMMLCGHRRRVEAFAVPDGLSEDESAPELWDQWSPHASQEIPTHRGQIPVSGTPTWVESLPPDCRGSIHLQGRYSLVLAETVATRGQPSPFDAPPGGMSASAIELACRLKQGLGGGLAPGRLSFDTALPGGVV